ncbi:hypothetical protein PIB30_072416 [Stylosanthes scabra]|uniref:CCHC-type domain-containing protein n=1 Tax=Stylosanthes scabra TaxID=79078 RepID=A0ABU6TPK5_9FABA|nr:hypothetical protein [Stylosanthes scabra]
MRRKHKGRPVSTRILNEMDLVERQEKRCGLCRQMGHTRNSCPNAPHPEDHNSGIDLHHFRALQTRNWLTKIKGPVLGLQSPEMMQTDSGFAKPKISKGA